MIRTDYRHDILRHHHVLNEHIGQEHQRVEHEVYRSETLSSREVDLIDQGGREKVQQPVSEGHISWILWTDMLALLIIFGKRFASKFQVSHTVRVRLTEYHLSLNTQEYVVSKWPPVSSIN